jgi:endonuclease YncB( thermonuclease family)
MKRSLKGVRKIRKDVLFLLVLILVFLSFNYPAFDDALTDFLGASQEVNVDRVIDGDTIEGNGTSIRLLGINTPERGEFLYERAKQFLSSNVQNKNVTLEFVGDREDKYRRVLAYIHFNEENINVKMVENGFANYYFYSGRDKYSEDLLNAWEICMEKKINLCEESKNSCKSCIRIDDSNNFLVNTCNFECDITNWQVRGEGREKFIFSEGILGENDKAYFVLNLENSGGSLFLRDEDGKLVSWKG